MRAIGYKHFLPIADETSLVDIDLPMPVLTGRDLLVRVEAVSVNPVVDTSRPIPGMSAAALH